MQCTKLSTKNTAVNKIKISPNRSLGGAGDTGLGYHLLLMSQLSLNKSALTDQVKQDSMFGNHCYIAICLEAVRAKESKEQS